VSSSDNNEWNKKKPSVAIIGGGIGGLTTANALLCRQVASRVTVYEQAPYFVSTAGAGFGFSPNGQICLASIGIYPERQQRLLHPFETIARANDAGDDVVAQSDAFKDLRSKFGFSIAGCLRADLVDVLVETLNERSASSTASTPSSTPPILYNHKLQSIQQTHGKVELGFENGNTDTVDIVVGADGIHSTVSKLIDIDDSPPIYSGANIFYGVIPDPDDQLLTHMTHLGDSSNSNNAVLSLLSQDHTVIQYPGPGECLSFRVGPPERKKMIWACTYVSDGPPSKDTEEWDRARNARDELQSQLLHRWPDGHPIHLFTSLTPESNDHSPGVLHFGLYRRRHKKTWFKGRIVLLGDSCHATLPYVGQGANQAIEDAIVLADCLHQHQPYQDPNGVVNVQDLSPAFQQYYDRRFQRTRRVVNMATILNYLYHTQFPPARMFADWLLTQVVSGGMVFKQIEKELLEECPVKDYEMYRPGR
jgi:salicylate hydroxylase